MGTITTDRQIVRTETTETRLYNLGTSNGTETSGIFMFAANDRRYLDKHGQIDFQKLFLTNPETGNLFTTPEEIEQHMANGYVSKWAELDDKTRTPITHTILATSSPDKLLETRAIIKFYDMKLKLANQAMGFTPEDSKEEQANGGEIVIDKIIRSIIDEMAELSPSQIKTIQATLGVENFDSTVAMSNDVSLMFDPQLMDTRVWDEFRNSEDLLIREVFQNNHDIPGKRTRELSKAVGGAPNLYRLLKKAGEELTSKGIQFNDKISSGLWLHVRPLEAGKTNLPDAGICIYQQLNNISILDISEELLQKYEQENYPFAMDEVEIPSTRVGHKNKDGNPLVLSNIRTDDPDYISEGGHPVGQMIHALFSEEFLNVARLEEPQNWDPITRPEKSTILVVGGSDTHVKKLRKELKKANPNKPVKIQYIRSLDLIRSSSTLEELANKSDAIVIPTMDYSRMTPEETLAWKSSREFVYAYRLALEGKGSNAMSGCPIFITPEAEKEVAYHGTFFNQGSSATKVDKVVHFYDGQAASLERALSDRNWDPEDYKSKNKRTHFEYDFLTEQDIASKLDINTLDELGPVVSVLGGATTEESQALTQAENFAYECARKGITIAHGGGTSGVMGAFIKGGIRAYMEGYRGFKQVGVRTPIVSSAEGSIKKYLRELVKDINNEQGTSYTIDDIISSGNVDSDNFALLDDHFHILEKNAFGTRQDLVLALGDYHVVFPGASGSAYENVHNNLNTALISLRGKGIYEGTERAKHTPTPTHIINIENPLDMKKAFWDALINTKTEAERQILQQSSVNNASDALTDISTHITLTGKTRRYIWHKSDVSNNNNNDLPALQMA